ncbi:MAG: restriction endonuclease subunit S [Clostridiales bacterium]|nr:restriction endonuclease subunit S [Clostridiales bacterium]
MCIIDREFSLMPIASTGFAVIACHAEFLNEFLFYYMMAPDFDSYANDTDNAKGVAYPAINDERLYRALIPLPPVAEQYRIVEKIRALIPYIKKYDQVEACLTKMNELFPGKLKKSILQLAVQGKLVPQDPNDEPASVLLERIRAEKEQLIKAGKIRRDKHESVIYRRDNSYYEMINGVERCIDDEIPFEIPDSWCWTRLSNIVSTLGDGIHGTPDYDVNGVVYFINGNNLSDGSIIIKDDTKKVSKYEAEKHRRVLTSNSILISINGTIGNIAFYKNEDIILGKSACFLNVIPDMSKYYLKVLFESDYFLKYALKIATGTTIKNVPLAGMRNFLVPIPPLSEQPRIVTKIEELLSMIKGL